MLNLGNQPPNIEGTFRVEPVIIQASTVPGEDDAIKSDRGQSDWGQK